MKKSIVAIVSLVVGLPSLFFSLYLTYQILLHIHGTELMWFLFWLLVPMNILFTILCKVVDAMKEDD